MKHLLFVVFLFGCLPLSVSLQAQLSDTFSDGNFTVNPVWEGETTEFIVNAAGELQLNAPDAGNSTLMTRTTIPYATVWDIKTRLEFAPTTANLLRIWLSANTLSNDADGYYLEIGESGNLDALRFFRKQNGTATLLATGTAGDVATDPTDVRIRVQRLATGEWAASLSKSNAPFTPQFTVTDAVLPVSGIRWFGVYCLFTATRKDKFFFDDIVIKADSSDTTPPVLNQINIAGNQSVALVFNEPLDSLTAVNTALYTLSGLGAPATVQWSSTSPHGVLLGFSSAFPNGQVYTLTCTGVRDWLGNAAGAQQLDFQSLSAEVAAENDIVINEIMAKPSPAQGLPATAEWVELLNRSNKYIQLSDLLFADATGSPKPLPNFLLPPDSIVVICGSSAATALLGIVSNVYAVTSFPSLNDDDETLLLTNSAGLVIDRVDYGLDWHTDENKKAGGWSLEQINPDLICKSSRNWQSCPALPGGSPGKRNFSYSTAPDLTAPTLLLANLSAAQTVTLTFSEAMDINALSNINNYEFTPSIVLTTATITPNNNSSVTLNLQNPLASSVVYTLRFKPALTDCPGNPIAPDAKAVFVLSETPQPEDIVINEIMAKPSPAQGLPETAEWVELLNRSGKYLRLSDLQIADATGSPKPLPDIVLAPDSLVVICGSSAATALAGLATNVYPVTSFPSLNDDDEAVVLTNSAGTVIDRVDYGLDWHTVEDKKDGGWSLEKINPNLTCLGKSNWQSCLQLPGGSPGKRNFSYSNAPDIAAPTLVLVNLINPQTLVVQFSEGMDPDALVDLANYQLSPAIILASAISDSRSVVTLRFATPVQASVIYTIRFDPMLSDCSGNAIAPATEGKFGQPEVPQTGDMIVNEILFNPATGGARFIEWYNKSQKIFRINQFSMVNYAKSPLKIPINTDVLVLPGEYWVTTTFPEDITTRFSDVRQEYVLDQLLPSLDDRDGNITLYWSDGSTRTMIDSFDYSVDLHNPLLSISDREGVSLERIRFDIATNNPNNWTSAAQNGSPTHPNGQQAPPANTDGRIVLSANRISPDGDGYEDYLDIQLNLPAAGYAATMTIYDSEGIPVKKVLRQQLTATTTTLRWDGDTDNGSRAQPGIYILFVELFNAEGQVERVKKTFAVVQKF